MFTYTTVVPRTDFGADRSRKNTCGIAVHGKTHPGHVFPSRYDYLSINRLFSRCLVYMRRVDGQGRSKEGFSVFGLFDRTRSVSGRRCLKQWMLKPLHDIHAITARQVCTK